MNWHPKNVSQEGWNALLKRRTPNTRERLPPPRGLTGRALGLYYRDRGRKEKKQNGNNKPSRELMIHFSIPPKVEKRVTANLQNIHTLANSLDINLAPIENAIPSFEVQDSERKDSSQSDVKDSTNEACNMPSSVKSENDCVPMESIDDSQNVKMVDHNLVTTKPINDEPTQGVNNTNSVNNEDDANSSNTLVENTDDPQVIKKPKTGIVMEETDRNEELDKTIPISSTKIKNDPESSLNTSVESIQDDHIFKKPKIELINEEFPQPGPSSAFLNDFETNERLMSLRGGGDYKYSYEDIITGSFDEKLDEALAKGITIKSQTDDIKRLSKLFLEEYNGMLGAPTYKKMLKFRETLPAYKKRNQLLEVINNNQVIVISGETGCGKSTQVPQIILDNAIRNNCGANIHILVTEPRRIAASSLAARVAQERAERIGKTVGFAVRLEKIDSRARGSIKYCTTGVLLSDLEVNQALANYSHIILDEVHERDCQVDLTMCLLKKLLQKRDDLKVILMSATLDAKTLSEYFNGCPLLHIEGLAYPVKDVYLEDILLSTSYELPPCDEQPKKNNWRRHVKKFAERDNQETQKMVKYRSEITPWLESLMKQRPEIRKIRHTLGDYRIEELNLDLILELLLHICKGPPGAILVFLPGIGDITKLMKIMEESRMFMKSDFEIYPLHSKLHSLDQHKIFERPRHPIRKIIIATNIAETSITIDDVVYVVDCARIKMSGLIVEENVCTLKTEWVSKTNLHQRRGRAGRCQPGICYHLATSYRAEVLADRLLPELQRSDLLEPVLCIKRLRLGKAEEAMALMPSPPAESTVKWAVKHLQQCGALNDKETLTPLGWHLARLPVPPSAGKLLLFGALFGCLDRAASVAAVWGFKDPFQLVIGKEREVDKSRRFLAQGEPSDHVAISEAIMQWERCPVKNRRSFSYENFISYNTVELLSEMKNQFGESLKRMGFLASGCVQAKWENRHSSNLSLFKAIIAASLYPNVATVRWIRQGNSKKNKAPRIKVYLPQEKKSVTVHPSSVMAPPRSGPERESLRLCNKSTANWLVYWLKQRSTDLFLIDVTLVYTLPVLFFGELAVKVLEEETDENMCAMSISAVTVRCHKRTARMLFELRALLDQFLASKIMVSGTRQQRHYKFEECVLNTVIELITAEDERAQYCRVDEIESDASEREN